MSEPALIRARPPRATVFALLQSQGLPISDITDAFRKDIRSVYLLTTTAEMFFNRLGYARVDRSQAPNSIARTPEFSQLCPTSSAFMFKFLQPTG